MLLARLFLSVVAFNFLIDAPNMSIPEGAKPMIPPHRSIDTLIYRQSAEYEAACYQAYHLATLQLREKVREFGNGTKPLAVIADLDETFIDNQGFDLTRLFMGPGGIEFHSGLWEEWEDACQAKLIPGANGFFTEASRLKVTVFFVSNRGDKLRERTKITLTHLGIPIEDKQLLLKAEKGSSDKTERRGKVSELGYQVIILLGDNLRDFDEVFVFGDDLKTDPGVAIAKRSDSLNRLKEKFGTEWIILPNPSYGEWTKPFGNGLTDFARQNPNPFSWRPIKNENK